MNRETFYVPSEIEYFYRDDNVLVVTANPVGWAIVNHESADILKALSKDKALTVKDLTTELQKYVKHVDKKIEELLNFLRALKDSYIILDDKTDGEQTNRLLKIGGVFIETTSQCNLRCKHCYLSAADSLENELTTNEIIDIVHQLSSPAVVALSGGEPLMRDDTISLLQQFAHEGYRCSLLTNATLITPDIASEIKKAKRATVQISLESFDKDVHESIRGKNTFDLTMEGIHNLLHASCRLRLSFTPTKLNIDTFEDYVDKAKALGIRDCY
jgi:sulfatase maturation enzyme AslB (radical SAM superfamily)